MTAITLPRPEDVELIMQRAPGMWPLMIELARATGLRIGVIITLRRDAIDWQRGTATVIGNGRGLKSKRRTISLQTFGVLDILRRVPVHPDCPFVFWQDECSKNRKRFRAKRPYTENAKSRFAALMRQTGKYCAKHGIEFERRRFHDLRHEHAVNWLRAGGGHSLYARRLRLGIRAFRPPSIISRAGIRARRKRIRSAPRPRECWPPIRSPPSRSSKADVPSDVDVYDR